MRFFSTARALVILSETVSRIRFYCSHQSSGYGYNHTRDAFLRSRLCSHRPTWYGLQSSEECISPASLVQSSVCWVRLQSSEGFLLEVPLVQSSAYLVWSTIIQGMRLFLHCWYMYRFIGLNLHLPRDAPISATLVHVLVYWSRSTIIYGMRLFLHLSIYRSRSTIIQGIRFFYITGTVISLLGMG